MHSSDAPTRPDNASGPTDPGASTAAPRSSRVSAIVFWVVFVLSIIIGVLGWAVTEQVWGYPRWPSVFTGCAVMVITYLLLLVGVVAVRRLSAHFSR